MESAPLIRCRQDHPRSCGEHLSGWSCRQAVQGSSPLVRGAPMRLAMCFRSERIIPARAGSTCAPRRSSARRRDHPRSCGEHQGVLRHTGHLGGSSPLVRGALRDALEHVRARRIIPARAGSTRSRARIRGTSWDHPRSCGEHSVLVAYVAVADGSSPLVRGALSAMISTFPSIRIIPARAGSTAVHDEAPDAR